MSPIEHPAQEREHLSLGAEQLNLPYYYSKWWSCQKRACATEVLMREMYKVMNKNAAARQTGARKIRPTPTRRLACLHFVFREIGDAPSVGAFFCAPSPMDPT
jgi:hypothetical protein